MAEETHTKETCVECGRKILVVHDGPTILIHSVVCGACLKINDSFEYAHPAEAMDLEEWVQSEEGEEVS